MLTVGELFAGIGGIGLGLERTGNFEVRWQVEKDDYASKVLAKNWPDVRRHDDVCTFPEPKSNDWQVDVIAGGFPCQDISIAGKGKGLKGERSGLFYEVVRIAEILRPKYLLLENVAMLLRRGMSEVLAELATLGYNAEWHCLPAASVGAPHRRDRLFIIAYPDNYGRNWDRENEQERQRQAMERGELFGGDGSDGYMAKLHNKLRDFRNDTGRKQWGTEPTIQRVVNGVPNRMDRIKCLGNSVCPQVAQVIGDILYGIHEEGTANG